MKTKRLLAILLSLAIILTSESFATVAHAAQTTESTTTAGQTTETQTQTASGTQNADNTKNSDTTVSGSGTASNTPAAGDTGSNTAAGTDNTASGAAGTDAGKGTGSDTGNQDNAAAGTTDNKPAETADKKDSTASDNSTPADSQKSTDKDSDTQAASADSKSGEASDTKSDETADKKDGENGDAKSDGTAGTDAASAADAASDESKSEEVTAEGEGAVAGEVISNGTFKVDTADGKLQLADDVVTPVKNSVKIPKEVKIIPKGIFSDKDKAGQVSMITFEEGSELTTIEAGAFAGSVITSIDIPAGVTEIPDAAFKNSKIRNITFKGTVTSIGAEAFANTPIEKITAKNVTKVGEAAFSGCTVLTTVTMGNLQTIGDDAFKSCTKLNNMAFAKSLKSIGKNAFYDAAFEIVDMSGVTGPLTMGENAFENNTRLTSVKLPDDLAKIPAKAFYGCKLLSSLTLGDGISSRTTTIDTQAFAGCTALKSLIFYNVKQFNAKAFDGCSALTSVIIRYDEPTSQNDFNIEEDAFPARKTAITMKGYDGKVKAYANLKGYKYVTLYKTNNITIDKYDSKLVTIVSSHSKNVTEGTEVKVTVTPKTGYFLTSFGVKADETVNCKLASNGSESQVFTFSMPGCQAAVSIKVAEKSEVKHGTLTYGMDLIDNYQPDLTSDGISFDKAGGATQLVIKDGGSRTNLWYFGFSSKNKAVATVTDTGVVRAVSPGRTTIVATSRVTGKTLNIPIIVGGEKVKIDRIVLTNPTSVSEEYTIGGVAYPGVTFDVNDVKTQGESLTATIEAFEKDDNVSLMVESQWTSSDTSVATVANAKSENNSNKITIKKGASGQAMITVTVKNEGDKEATEENTKKFVICVVDKAPRLSKSSITVNSSSTTGTRIELIPVDGYEIEDGSVSLYTKNSAGSYNDFSKLIANNVTEDGHYYVYIRNAKPAAPFTATYSEGTRLYLRGRFAESGSQFTRELTEVKVTNTELNPTVKFTGKINLFYADPERSGEAVLTQSLKNEIISKVVFVSDANKKNNNIGASDDPFAANFQATPDFDSKGVSIARITRKNAILEKVNDKAVVSGYAYIYYEGYENPVIRQVTIPTTTTVPSYTLSTSSAETSTIGGVTEYDLQLLTKDKDKTPLDLQYLDQLYFGEDTTLNAFETLDVDQAKATGFITLRLKDLTPGKKTAVICVKDSSWTKEVKYTFTLNVTDNIPKVTPQKTTVTLNQAYDGASISTPLNITQSSAYVSAIECVYSGSSKYIYDANTINVSLDTEGSGKIRASLPAGATVTKTTYKYKVTPVITFANKETRTGAPFTLSVKVTKNAPTIKLKKTEFALNTKYTGSEEAATTYTLGNLPSDADSKLLNTGYDASNVVSVKNAPAFSSIASIRIDGEENEIGISLLPAASNYVGKTYTYKLEGLTTEYASGKLKAPKITLKIKQGNIKVKAKASGSLNPVNADSAVVYSTTVSNYSGEIESVEVRDVDSATASYNKVSEIFEAEVDPANPRKVRLTIKDDSQGQTVKVEKKKYRLALIYKINGSEYPVIVKVTPKQVLPKIKTKATDTTMYSNNTRKQTANVSVTVTADKGKTVMAADVVDVDFADSASKKVKNAFEITPGEDGTWNITLKDKTLAQNKSYTLKLETTYDGQIENTTGSTFKVKVKVKK